MLGLSGTLKNMLDYRTDNQTNFYKQNLEIQDDFDLLYITHMGNKNFLPPTEHSSARKLKNLHDGMLGFNAKPFLLVSRPYAILYTSRIVSK